MRTLTGVAGETENQPFSRAAAHLLGALLIAGLLLRFYRLEDQSFWLDELWTVVAGDPRLSMGRWLADWVLPDVHPPLYQLLVRQWQSIAGNSELSLRLTSALFSAGLVLMVPLVQRWTPVTRQPLALAAWFACSTGAVVYAREARAYALLLLLAAAATLLGAAIARRMDRGEDIRRPLVVLAAAVVVAEYSHYFGALVAGGVFGALGLFALQRDRRYLPPLALTGVLAVGALVPWLVVHLPYLQAKTGGYFWIQNNWSVTFPDAASYAAGAPWVFLVICAAAAAVLGRRPHVLRRPQCFVPLVMFCLMTAAAVVISLHTPVVTPRNLMILIPPFYLIAIASCDALLEEGSRSLRVAGMAAPVLAVAVNLGFTANRVVNEEKDDWRAAAGYIASLPGCRGAPLPVNFWPREVYAYYLPGSYRDHLVPVTVQSLERAPRSLSTAAADDCALVLWSAHMTGDRILRSTLEVLDLERGDVAVREFRGHLVILDASPRDGRSPPGGATARN